MVCQQGGRVPGACRSPARALAGHRIANRAGIPGCSALHAAQAAQLLRMPLPCCLKAPPCSPRHEALSSMRCSSAASSMYSSGPTSQALLQPVASDTKVTCGRGRERGEGERAQQDRAARCGGHSVRCHRQLRRNSAGCLKAILVLSTQNLLPRTHAEQKPAES